MFEFKITLNDDDYFAYNKYHLLNNPQGKKSLLVYKWWLPLFAFANFFIFVIAKMELGLIVIESILLTTCSIWWLISYKKLIIKRLRKNIEKLKDTGKLPYSKNVTLEFCEDFISETTPQTQTKMEYSIIEKIVFFEQYIYIYTNSIQAHIIPLTVFFDEQHKTNFINFIQNKIDNNKAV